MTAKKILATLLAIIMAISAMGMTVFAETEPAGSFGGYAGYGGTASGTPGTESYRENLQVDVYGVKAQKSVVLDMYSGETLLSTTKLRQADRDDETALLFPVDGDLTVNIVITGRLAGSWDTEWFVTPSIKLIPDKFVLTVDDKVTDTWTDGMSPVYNSNFVALPGVEKPEDFAWTDVADTDWYVNADADATSYTIKSATELAGLAKLVNEQNSFAKKTIKLGADIDLANIEWTPIGKSGATFQGTFDGQNHTISNLKINSTESYIGLFGYTSKGEVKNLTLHNVDIDGSLGVGAFAGCPHTSDYTNLKLTGDVTIDAKYYVGGMLGRNFYGDGTNLTVDVKEGSYVKADSVDVTDEGTISYRTYVGGVVGFMGEGKQKLTNVHSNIDVIGTVCDVGGIAGIAHYGNTFDNVSSSGNVKIEGYDETDGTPEIGGIAGVWHNKDGTSTSITNATYTGELSLTDTNGNPVEDIDLSVYKIAGPSYLSKGSGTLTVPEGTKVDGFTVDGKVYTTFDIALNAANDAAAAATIDMNGKTAAYTTEIKLKNDITITNGTIDISGASIAGDALFCIGNRTATPNLTLDGVDIIGDTFSTAYGIFYIIKNDAGEAGTLTIKNSDIHVKNEMFKSAGLVKGDGAMSKLVMENVNVDFENYTRIFNQLSVDLKDTKVNAYTTDDTRNLTNELLNNAIGKVTGTLNNTKIYIDGCEHGIKMYGNGETITLKNGSVVSVQNAAAYEVYYTDTTNLVDVQDTSSLDAEIYLAAEPTTEDELTAEIEIDFAATGDANVYKIYAVAADNKAIHRLSTAQLKFAFAGVNGAAAPSISYKLTPAANVAITSDLTEADAYLFNFDGVTNVADKSGVKVELGTVTFEGYGAFVFKAIEYTTANTNSMITTASLENNIVKTYIPNGTNNNLLTLGDTGVVSLEQAKRDVEVSIDFTNNITAGNAALYNDMTVTLVASNGDTYVGKLGTTPATPEEDVVYADVDENGATVTFTFEDVIADLRYTVTVEGEGYRTASYSTLVAAADEALELKFWNNAQDEGKEIPVEKGVEASKEAVTFLAGDIVEDKTIDVYDLSAVVSYFGQNLTMSDDVLVKYDLNRDGRIDARDVAYVLVSWGR